MTLALFWLLTRTLYLFTQSRGWVHQDWEYGTMADLYLQTGRILHQFPWMAEPVPSAYIPPGLVLLIAFLKKHFANHYFAAWAAVQLVVGTGTWLCFRAACRRILSRNLATIAALLFILDLNLYSPMRWANETAFSTFFMTAFFLALLIWDKSRSVAHAGLVGAILGAAGMFHASFAVQIPVALGWIIGRCQYRKAAHCAVLLCAWALMLTPWTIRNYRTFHQIIPADLHLGEVLWMGWNPQSCGGIYKLDGSPMKLEPDLVERLKALKTEPEISAEFKRTALRHALSNPPGWLWQRAAALFFFWHEQTFWAAKSSFRTEKAFWLGLYNLALLCLFIPCAVIAWRSFVPGLRLALAIIGTLSLTHALTIADIGNRYRMPLEPLIILVIAYGLFGYKEEFYG